MEKTKGVIKAAWPYQQDKMNLPVASVEDALKFYLDIMGFRLISRSASPIKNAVISRDGIEIGLAENDGDPTQDGCFFEVENVNDIYEEFKSNGLRKEEPVFDKQMQGNTAWKVFFVVAPDGLCYCLGEKV